MEQMGDQLAFGNARVHPYLVLYRRRTDAQEIDMSVYGSEETISTVPG